MIFVLMSQHESTLTDKHITVGVGGGIAAFKTAYLVSQLRQKGARVQVILTRAGAQFVTPLTFAALSHRPVLQDLFADEPLNHVRLAHETDLFVVAPATYDLIGKLANGLADDYLTTTLAATQRPVLLCPAMETQMFASAIFQKNLKTLEALHYRVLAPATGALASGREGMGRLPEPEQILAEIEVIFSTAQILSNKRVLVTAGPTRERLDPMRVISNRSSGKMGYALAQAARELGGQVTLVTGPSQSPLPPGVETVRVESAQDMFEQVVTRASQADLVLMAAAVADWTPKHPDTHKQSKQGKSSQTLELLATKDILKHLGQHRHDGQVLVGFAAETHDFVEKAKQKLQQKNADFFVANDVTKAAESDQNAVVLLSKDGLQQSFPVQHKQQLARQLLQAIVNAM